MIKISNKLLVARLNRPLAILLIRKHLPVGSGDGEDLIGLDGKAKLNFQSFSQLILREFLHCAEFYSRS